MDWKNKLDKMQARRFGLVFFIVKVFLKQKTTSKIYIPLVDLT